MSALQSLELQELRRMQALYRTEWPKYCREHYMIQNFIAFLKLEPEIKHLNAYTLNDERAQDLGLFLIVDRYQLFVGCLGDSFELLEQALHLIDWSRGLYCSTIPERYVSTFFKVIQERQLPVDFHHKNLFYHLPAKQALKFQVDCPQGFYLQSLAEEKANFINETWPYKHEGSLYFFQKQIRLCLSMGLYDQESNELVAWCIRSQDSLLAALQVKKTHKRRGFGSLLVQAMSQRIAESGDDITAEIYSNNAASLQMFSKLGFKQIDNSNWLCIKPAVGEFSWLDGE